VGLAAHPGAVRIHAPEKVAGDDVVVARLDAHALVVGHVLAHRIRLLHEPRGLVRLSQVEADQRERGEGGAEIGVELDRAQVVGLRGRLAMVEPLLAAHGVRLERLEGRGGDHLDAARELLDLRKGLAQLGAQPDGRPVDGREHRRLAVRPGLFGDQDVAADRVQRLQPDHVVLAERQDRAGDHGPATRPLGHLERHFARQLRARLVHDREERVHLAVGEHVQELRLGEVQREGGADGFVEDRITRLVLDVRDQDLFALALWRRFHARRQRRGGGGGRSR
jgi:hypothetical protein